MKTAFVTGISGLLGCNLVHELTDEGYKVKGLIRNKTRFHGKVSEGSELIEGGLFDDFRAVLKDCDVVIHAAAETSPALLTLDAYKKVNFDATVNLFNQAKECGVRKFIFISTANTLGFGTAERPGDETCKMCAPFSGSHYAVSKFHAEEFLLQNAENMQVIIINPTFMLGAFDSKPSSGKIILMGLNKKVVFHPPGGKNFVHVKDVARVTLSAINSGRHGERYLACSENLTYKQFFTKLNSLSGQNSVLIEIPAWALKFAGKAGDKLRNFGIKTPLNSANMESLCINNFFSNAKSVKEFGLRYKTTEEAISDAVNYFKAKNRT